MNESLINMLFSKLMKKWGPSKLTKVLGLIAIGAGSFGYVGATFIPDEPEEDPVVDGTSVKQNKKKSTKKENV